MNNIFMEKVMAFRSLPLLLLLLLTCSCQAQDPPPLPTIPRVDLSRYMGRWYEIARFDHRFQRGCVGTYADYSLRADGDVEVLNSCRVETLDGPLKKAQGRAWRPHPQAEAKFKVQFFLSRFKIPFLAGNYWILALDPDYQYALIGGPSRKYLWILSRTPQMPQEIYQQLVAEARDLHFPMEQLIPTPQPQGSMIP